MIERIDDCLALLNLVCITSVRSLCLQEASFEIVKLMFKSIIFKDMLSIDKVKHSSCD